MLFPRNVSVNCCRLYHSPGLMIARLYCAGYRGKSECLLEYRSVVQA
jgi:hypothetical protein